MDLWISILLFATISVVGAAYALRARSTGRLRSARLDEVGASAFLGPGPREAFYWAIGPAARLLVRMRATPDAVTLGALGVGMLAAIAIVTGHDGVGAALLAASCAGDALDGRVARERGVACAAGEVVDAVADRYQEMLVLGALVLRFRHDVATLSLAVAALCGAVMVSYVTAKAEAMGLDPPRGTLRRAERATWLTVGVALVPITSALVAARGAPAWLVTPLSQAPLLLVLSAFAVIGNASSIVRAGELASRLRAPARAPLRDPRLVETCGEASPSIARVES